MFGVKIVTTTNVKKIYCFKETGQLSQCRDCPWTPWLKNKGLICNRNKRIFSSPCCPDGPCSSPILISNRCRGLFSCGHGGQNMKPTIHHHTGLWLRICGLMHSLPMSSGHLVSLIKNKNDLTLTCHNCYCQ
jgi:hypothetical protein